MSIPRRLWVFGGMLFLAASASAETVELVTYYPAPGQAAGDMDTISLTVGNGYNAVTPPDGTAIIEDRLGIGTNNPQGVLHVVGAAPADQVLFSPGAGGTLTMGVDGTMRVGAGGEPAANAVLDLVSTTRGFLPPRTQRTLIAAPTAGMQIFDTDAGVPMFYNGARWLEVGAPPIGTIQAWHKSYVCTPLPLPWGWRECNGQPVADADSPYNGQNLPNLNSNTQDGSTASGMFLRGCSGSVANPTGTMFADATAVNGLVAATNAQFWNYSPGMIAQMVASPYVNGATPYILHPSNTTTISNPTETETRPANMTVVWIIRVK